MQAKPAVLHFAASKNCFISLPREWTTKLAADKVHVYEVQNEAGSRLVTSWAGAVTTLADQPIIELNGLFASKQGFQHGSEVVVRQLRAPPACCMLHVQPVSVDDWEILEQRAAAVAAGMLSTVRAVGAGMVFPVWCNNICVFLKIGEMDPASECLLLVQNSEVIVAPKERYAKIQQAASPVQNSIKQSSVENTSPSQSSSQQKPEMIPNGDAERSSSKSTEEITQTDGNQERSQQSPGMLGRAWGHVTSWWGGQDQSEESVSSGLCSAVIQETETPLCNEYDLPCMCGAVVYGRVLPLRDLDDAVVVPSGDAVAMAVHLQPSIVYISVYSLLQQLSDKLTSPLDCPVSFLARVSKVQSPTEKEEGARKAAGSSEKINLTPMRAAIAATGGGTVTKAPVLPKQQGATSSEEAVLGGSRSGSGAVVRVVVLDPTGGSSLVPGMTVFSPGVGGVVVPDLLRRQVAMERTGRIKMCAVRESPASLKTLTLSTFTSLPEGFAEDHHLITAFSVWLNHTTTPHCPLVINQGTVVRILFRENCYGDVVLHFTADSSPDDTDGTHQYCLLDPTKLGQVKVIVKSEVSKGSLPICSLDTLDPTIPTVTSQQLGGVCAAVSACVSHLEMCLCERPLCRRLTDGATSMSQGAVLLTGKKGVGKTSLAYAVCHRLAQPPNHAHISVLDCKTLKGKRVDNIQKAMQRLFDEASWRQPSVLLLDDLDQLTSAPAGPEQEMSGEAAYHTKVAEALKWQLLMAHNNAARLGVLVTSQSRGTLHSLLTNTRGHHLLQTTVDIPPPDKKQRLRILEAIILKKSNISPTTLDNLDLTRVASKTDGFVASDLDLLVNRALHAHLKRGHTSNGESQMLVTQKPVPEKMPKLSGDLQNPGTVEELNKSSHAGQGAGPSRATTSKCRPSNGRHHHEIVLQDADFVSAVEGWVAGGMRLVELHTAGERGWESVGGLHAVRDTLQETLSWPSKYPELFAACPLRLRSGLLLYGAPGTGKTLLAGVVAKECELNFISIKGPELLSKYIGASEQAVRDTFLRAQSAAPCILFFDEFDALAPRRGHDSTGVTDRVVNQLLTQLDGVEGLQGVYVLAATSRPDLIDPALLRPGRLDKALHCPLPDQTEREEILHALTRGTHLSDDVDLSILAAHCESFTGADLKALLYDSQLAAIHEMMGTSTPAPPDLTTHSPPTPATDTSDEAEDSVVHSPAPCIPSTDEDAVLHPPICKPWPHFSYIHSLEDGVTQMEPEEEERTRQQLSAFMLSPRENAAQSPLADQPAGPIVSQRHLASAVADMSPSVTETERRKYQRIYEGFLAGRDFSGKRDEAGKRITLA